MTTPVNFTVTVELPAMIEVQLGDKQRFTKVPLQRIIEGNNAMARLGMIAGFTKAINDVSRGKDENGKDNSDDVWMAARDKRVDTWLAGNWGSTSRAPSKHKAVWEQFVAEQMAKGLTLSAIGKKRGELIKHYVGAGPTGKPAEDTVANFLTALGKATATDAATIEAKLWERAELARIEREKAAAAPKGFDLSDFLADAGVPEAAVNPIEHDAHLAPDAPEVDF